MGDWTLWIPNEPGWAAREDVMRLGSLQQRWIGEGWQGMAISAVLASFFLVAIAYMIAKAFNHEGLGKWVRSELYQVLANALLVVGLIALVELAVSGASAVTADIAQAAGGLQYAGAGQYVDNPFVLSQLFLDENIQCLKTWFLRLFIADSIIEPIEQFNVGIAGMDVVSLSMVLGPVVSALYFASHNVVFLLLANYFQRHLLIFIFQTMFTVFLPIGIILRTLPVTRGFGGFLISVSIGLYLVYPLSYSAMLLTTRQMEAGECQLSIRESELRGIQITDPASFSYHKGIADRLLDTVLDDLNVFRNVMPFFLFRSFLFPLVALTLVFTFVRATSAFFGADIAEMGRGLVKLI